MALPQGTALFYLNQELPRGAWVLGTGGMRACQDNLTHPLPQNWCRGVKLNCLDVTLKLCKDRPVSGLTSKL